MTWARITDNFPATIDQYALTVNAVYLYIRSLQQGIATGSDGIISVISARLLLQAKAIRNKDRVIAELVDAGLWTWIDADTLQIDWTGQETASDRAVKLEAQARRQAEYVSTKRRCESGDHSMCAGKNRRCQATADGVSDATHSTPSPRPSHTTPVSKGVGRERGSDGSASPPGQRSDAGAPTLPGPSSGKEKSAPSATAPTKRTSDQVGAFDISSPEMEEAFKQVDAIELGK